MRPGTRLATAAASTLALTTALVVGGGLSTADAGDTIVGDPVPVAAGTITVTTTAASANATVSWPTTADTVQTWSTNAKDKCSLVNTVATGKSNVLLTTPFASSTSKAVSYASKSIGVASANKTTGTACYQVNQAAGESLGFTLNNAAGSSLTSDFGSVRVSDAKIDVNLSGNAVIVANLFRGGVQIGQAQLESGFSTPYGTLPGFEYAQISRCNDGTSNSGPQNKYNNNCYWTIGALTPGNGAPLTASTQLGALDWDSIVLVARVGDFSVQGGAAYAGAPATVTGGPTLFNLRAVSEGQINCGDSTATANPGTDGVLSSTTFWRLDNGLDSEPCTKLPYSVDSTSTGATFHKPTSVNGQPQTSAQFYVRMLRHFPTPTNPVTAAKVNWEDGSGTVTDLPYCGAGVVTGIADSWSIVNGVLTPPTFRPTVDYPTVQAQTDQSPVVTANGVTTGKAGLQYACVYSQQSTLNDDGSLDQVDWIYFTGDILLTTKR